MNVEPPSPLHGPEFSSYAAAEVSWLLTDLSHVALEAPAEQREAMMQAKAGHYAESLPIEYQPTGSTSSCSTRPSPRRRSGSRTPSASSPNWSSPPGTARPSWCPWHAPARPSGS